MSFFFFFFFFFFFPFSFSFLKERAPFSFYSFFRFSFQSEKKEKKREENEKKTPRKSRPGVHVRRDDYARAGSVPAYRCVERRVFALVYEATVTTTRSVDAWRDLRDWRDLRSRVPRARQKRRLVNREPREGRHNVVVRPLLRVRERERANELWIRGEPVRERVAIARVAGRPAVSDRGCPQRP